MRVCQKPLSYICSHAYGVLDSTWRYDMTEEEAVELGRRAIYHATHRDAYTGGIVNGSYFCCFLVILLVYLIKQDGWHKISADDCMDLHYQNYKGKDEQYQVPW